ncbi:hypothetical protein B0H13DRAFT_2319777 [Mycena leptocephala]|nr:hypothetical protein B0H13DRAFT_2319777 [Mycena leptocephala]
MSQQWINRYKKINQKHPDRAGLAQEASVLLAMAPWGCPKPPGTSGSEPFHTLWRFVGPHWLTGSQMYDMLELLWNRIDSSPDLTRTTRIQGTALAEKIIESCREAPTDSAIAAVGGYVSDAGRITEQYLLVAKFRVPCEQ